MSKKIVMSVGIGGGNLVVDVMTVQFLLNCVPTSEGGPAEELVIDGLVGPLTIGAIRRFQHAHFGWADGRVDPEHAGGVTIVKLNEFDPTPDAPPFEPPSFPHLPQGGGKRRHGKRRGKKVSGRPTSIFVPPFETPGKKGGGKVGGKKVSS